MPDFVTYVAKQWAKWEEAWAVNIALSSLVLRTRIACQGVLPGEKAVPLFEAHCNGCGSESLWRSFLLDR